MGLAPEAHAVTPIMRSSNAECCKKRDTASFARRPLLHPAILVMFGFRNSWHSAEAEGTGSRIALRASGMTELVDAPEWRHEQPASE